MSNDPRIHFPPFALDPVNECLWQGSTVIRLRPKAFGVLEQLVSRAGELVSKQDLISAVWPDRFVGDAVLKVAIRQIREALFDNSKSPRFIETAHRRGYRFIADTSVGLQTPARDGATPGASAPARLRPADLPAAIVGRELALSRMLAWLDRARGGERQVVFVTGEPGIGKTTLLDSFARSIRPDRTVRMCSGHCLAHYGMGEAPPGAGCDAAVVQRGWPGRGRAPGTRAEVADADAVARHRCRSRALCPRGAGDNARAHAP